MSPDKLRLLALHIASEGAAHARARFRGHARVTQKTGFEIVTEVDFAVEALVRSRLVEADLGIVVIGEETGRDGHAGDDPDALLAFVDPIDGTTNYAHGHPFYATSIGLWRGGSPVAGAVVAPSLQLAWSASSDGPAYRNEERCEVTRTTDLADALLATGFPYDRRTSTDDNLRAFGALKKRVQGIRRCGSAAIDLCLVADGTYDGYWERKLMPWDLAAGALIAARAGARVTTDDGGALHLGPTSERVHVLAANPDLHDAIGEALRAAAG
jgi:myo-inositol-1(or 4)-monophosphatase